MKDKCYGFADEAFWAGNRAEEGALKGLITERYLEYEQKNHPRETGENNISIVMASNEDWVVPATLDERRFAVFNVSSHKQSGRTETVVK